MANGGTSSFPSYKDLPVFCGPLLRKDATKTGATYFDVNFLDTKEPLELFAISFQNYYVYSISIQQQVSVNTFVTLLDNKHLMTCPHEEAGSQDTFCFQSSDFCNGYTKGRTLRFLLVQPSSMWNKFELRNFKALGSPPQLSPHNHRDTINTGERNSNINRSWIKGRVAAGDSMNLMESFDSDLEIILSAKPLYTPLLPVQSVNKVRPTGKRKEKKARKAMPSTPKVTRPDSDDDSTDDQNAGV